MSYTHLSITERSQLALLHRLGWSTRAIATELNRHHSTIARELNRGLEQADITLSLLMRHTRRAGSVLFPMANGHPNENDTFPRR